MFANVFIPVSTKQKVRTKFALSKVYAEIIFVEGQLCFMHNLSETEFCVSHFYSGMRISCEKTAIDAINDAKRKLKSNPDKVKEAKKLVEDTGFKYPINHINIY